MTELDAALVRRKLATITVNLDELARIEQLSLEEYRRDRMRRKATERMLQEAIEAAVDAAAHLLRGTGSPRPPDYYQTFLALGDAEVVPPGLAERLAPAAGLRNRLVHEYEAIDDARVFAAITSARRDLGDFVEAIEDFLSARGR